MMLVSLPEFLLPDFLKSTSTENQEQTQTRFPNSLKLSQSAISINKLSAGHRWLSCRYKLSPSVPEFTTGVLAALMDELSSLACFSVGLRSGTGLSLKMQMELVQSDLSKYSELDIVTTVTKVGNSIAQTQTDFICTSSKEMVAYASQIKYMRSDHWLANWTSPEPIPYEDYVKYSFGTDSTQTDENKGLVKDVILPNLEFLEEGHATFRIEAAHTNLLGNLHGGCQAMLMEQVAEKYAQHHMKVAGVTLKAMQVEYTGGAKGDVDIVCEAIGGEEHVSDASSLNVRVALKEGNKVRAEGKLLFHS